MRDMDVCYHCMEMRRPYLHPLKTLKVYHWIDPHGEEQEICGHHIEMMCEDCSMVHWAVEVKCERSFGETRDGDVS